MSAKVKFSWKNQKGIGMALIFLGWAIIFQIPAFIHSFLIFNLTSIMSDVYLYLGIFFILTPVLGGMMATIYENLYDPLADKFVNQYTLILINFVVFYAIYLLSVPFINTLEPYLALPIPLNISNWLAFMISVFSGALGIFAFMVYSETRNKI